MMKVRMNGRCLRFYRTLGQLVLICSFISNFPAPVKARAEASSIFDEKRPSVWLELSVAEFRQAEERFYRLIPETNLEQVCAKACSMRPVQSKESPAAADNKTASTRASQFESLKAFGSDRDKIREEMDGIVRESRGLLKEINELRIREINLKTLMTNADALQKIPPEGQKKYKDLLEETTKLLADKNDRLLQIRSEFIQRKKQLEEIDGKMRILQTHVDEKSGLTLLEFYVVMNDREKVDWLLQQEAGGTLRQQLIIAAKKGDKQRVFELLEVGADIYQYPGKYSALAWADTFGYQEIGAMLKISGAWIEVPWDPNHLPTRGEVLSGMESQLNRIIRFSNRMKISHTATLNTIAELRCKFNCLKRYLMQADKK